MHLQVWVQFFRDANERWRHPRPHLVLRADCKAYRVTQDARSVQAGSVTTGPQGEFEGLTLHATLRASLSGTLPEVVTPLKGHLFISSQLHVHAFSAMDLYLSLIHI